MKTLSNHTIIYDHECPMCNVYTKAFVKTSMLDANGQMPYAEAINSEIPYIDWQRARNEIALIDRETQTVKYGVESLTTIIGHRFPIFKPLFNLRVFQLLISHFYAFVSYNRKAIAPGATFEAENACTPDLNYTYRWAYIVFAWLVTSSILLFYAKFMVPVVPETSFLREFIICGGQIAFQGIMVAMINRNRLIHYLGNLMTISLMGALLLVPMLILSVWIHNPLIAIAYFFLVVGFMFLEHLRRTSLLELPWTISASWVMYRFLVLCILLFS